MSSLAASSRASATRAAAPSPAALRLLAVIALLPAPLVAQTTFNWTGNVDFNWNVDGNWDLSGTPATLDSVVIGGNTNVVINGDVSAANVALSGDAITSGSTNLFIGSGASLTIGSDPQSADLLVGSGGNASLTVSGGGVLTLAGLSANYSAVGYQAVGTATVESAGSIWTTGDLAVGVFAQGTLNIRDGGVVNSLSADVANGSASGPGTTVGTVLVTGSGSQWNVSGAFKIGGYVDEDYYNSGTLTITDGASITAGGGTGIVEVQTNGVINIGDGALAGTLNASEVYLRPTTSPDDPAPSATLPTLRFNHTDNITFAPAITGEGQVIKDGSGTATFTNANSTYSGATLVNDGTLVIDIGGEWQSATAFQVTGGNTTLRIASGSTVAADITVTAGTVEVAGQLDGGTDESILNDATLRILSGGETIGGYYTLNGASVIEAGHAGAINGGSFLLNGASTVDFSAFVPASPDPENPDAPIPGAMTDGELIFAGNRTVALPAPGVVTGGYIGLADDVSTDLNQAGQIRSIFDDGGRFVTGVDLDLYDNAHATISATAAVDGSLVTLTGNSTLSITAACGITNGELDIYDDAVATLGVDNALRQSAVLVGGNGALVLNGHETTIVGLAGDGRIVNSSETGATLTLDTATACGCGSDSFFFGTLIDGVVDDGEGNINPAGSLTFSVSGNGSLYVGSALTHTGGTHVFGATLTVVKFTDPDFPELNLNGSIAGQLTLSGGATLAGSGTVDSVTVLAEAPVSAILSPGDFISGSVGTLTTGNVTLDGNVEWNANLADATAGAGIGTDLIQSATGSLTLSADPGDTLTIFLISGGDSGNSFEHFNPAADGSWVLASFGGGIVNFNSTNIIVDTTYFGDDFSGAWSTRLGNSDRDLELIYTAAIPEPASAAAISAALAAFALGARRRRRR